MTILTPSGCPGTDALIYAGWGEYARIKIPAEVQSAADRGEALLSPEAWARANKKQYWERDGNVAYWKAYDAAKAWAMQKKRAQAVKRGKYFSDRWAKKTAARRKKCAAHERHKETDRARYWANKGKVE